MLFAGRLDPQKGVDVLLDALAALPAPRPRVLLAGEGPEEGALRDRAARLGVAADVSFLGRRIDVAGLLRGATVCCLPSRSEGLSNTLLEALAAGTPVVASDLASFSEVTGSDATGDPAALLVPQGDPAALARALARVLSDPALRQRLAAAGSQRVQAYAMDRVVQAHLELLERLPSPRPPGASRTTVA